MQLFVSKNKGHSPKAIPFTRSARFCSSKVITLIGKAMITEGINSLKEIANFKAKVKEKETAITEPKLSDYSLMGSILEIVKDECFKLNIQEYKPYYVAIVAYLYSPRVYMGGAFEYGVRPALARTLSITGQGITYYIVNVRNWITIYKSFSINVEYLYNKVVKRLKI